MPDPRVALCLFCDDIRHEVGNKTSYMGIYLGEISVTGRPPLLLPKFGIVVWVITDSDDPVITLSTTVKAPPTGEVLFRTEPQQVTIPDLAEDSTKMLFQTTIPISPMPLQGEGFIEVLVETERETLKAGRLKVRFIDPPQ